MLIPMGEALRQLKWLWFSRQAHNLQHLQAFDDASRGLWGAFQLILSTRGKAKLAAWGALITLIALAIDPFTQQVVVYEIRATANGNATISRAQNWDSDMIDEIEGEPAMSISFSMQAAIFNGLYGDQNASAAAYDCPSGNCTWPTFSSLGFCSKCSDVTAGTSMVETINNANSIYNIWQLPTLGNLTQETSRSNVSSFGSRISTSAILGAVIHLGSVIGAFECQLYYCIRTYNVTSVNGSLYSLQTSSWLSNDSVSTSTPNMVSRPSNVFVASNSIVLKPPSSAPSEQQNQSYIVNMTNSETLAEFFSGLFEFSAIFEIYDTERTLISGGAGIQSIAELFYSYADPTPTVDSLATSKTDQSRNLPGNNNQVVGTAWKTETYIHVRWWWLALPITAVLMALLFLMATIIENRQMDVWWKSSVLPLVLHGLEDKYQGHLRGLGEMDEAAQKLRVKLNNVPGGKWGLVQT
ncbi:hypothetical protein MMC13_004361 [Lambiella insularis]|nr:hypothetical protein [Lambiella insularis]